MSLPTWFQSFLQRFGWKPAKPRRRTPSPRLATRVLVPEERILMFGLTDDAYAMERNSVPAHVLVLANDNSSSGPLEITGFSQPTTGGSVGLLDNPNGPGTDQLVFTVDPEYTGNIVFTYTAQDATGSPGTGNASVTVSEGSISGSGYGGGSSSNSGESTETEYGSEISSGSYDSTSSFESDLNTGSGNSSNSSGNSSGSTNSSSGSGSGSGSSSSSTAGGVVAVDIEVALPLQRSRVEIDILSEVSPLNSSAGHVYSWENGSHGIVNEVENGVLAYQLYGYASKTEYENQKQEYMGQITTWASYHANRIDAEYDQQRSALSMLQSFLEEQDQAESFWEHISGAAGAGSFITGPYGMAFTLASATAAVISMHASDPAPNFISYWGDMVDKLTLMEVAAETALALEKARLESVLIAELPPAVALTTDQFEYQYQNTEGQLSVGTVTVNLEGRIDYYARLQGLHNNFTQNIKLAVFNPYRPVHRAVAVYGDALLGYATSRGWSMHIDMEDLDPYGTGEVIWSPHWQIEELEWPFTFGADDIAAELTSINFMLPGFEVYLNLP